MIKYFKELLSALKSIDASLKLITKCVNKNHRSYGDNYSISAKHWND